MASREDRYRCTVERSHDGQVRRIFVEAEPPDGKRRTVHVNGRHASRLAGPLHDALRTGGVTGRAWSSAKPIELSRHPGEQAELLLIAAKPLRRGDRIDAVAEGVATMSREEASYWRGKAMAPGGLRALRVLLTAGGLR